MKKTLLTIVLALAGTALFAQKTMVVNTEKIFKSLPSYTTAIAAIDTLAQQYQRVIDSNYASVEKQYNDYQARKAYLTESARRAQEDAINAREKEIEQYQQDKFGQDGEIIKKRVDLIKPIQDKVFGVISKYAAANAYTVVLDTATNPTIIYFAPAIDKTEEIIKLANQ